MVMAGTDQRAKVVVRHLPPNLDEDGFKAMITDWLDKIDYFIYVKGKQSMKELVHSRAYLRFTDPQDVLRFTHQLDGHAFLTERGTQFRCSVEFAPYQKVPKTRTKRDPREGTLDRDADFQAFVERLQAGPTPLPSAESQLASREAAVEPGAAATPPVVTALMQFLRDRRLQPKPTPAGPAGKERRAGKGEPHGSKAAAAAAAAAHGKQQQQQKGAAKGPKQKPVAQQQQPQLQAPKVLQPPGRKQQQVQQAGPALASPAASKEKRAAGAAAAAADTRAAAGSGQQQAQHAQQAPQQSRQTPKQLLKKPPAAAAPAAAAPQVASAPAQRQRVGGRGRESATDQEPPVPAAPAAPAAAAGVRKKVERRGQQAGPEGSTAREAAHAPAAAAAAPQQERKVLRRPQPQQGEAGGSGTTAAEPTPAPASEEASRARPGRRTRAGWGVYQPKRVGRLLDGEGGEEGA